MAVFKPNKKDLELLEILDKNSRASLREISSQLKISKQAINKKINNLKKRRIIKFLPIIDYFKLGYSNTHIYLKLRGIKKEEYGKIIKKLEGENNISWISQFFGDFDLGISIFYKSLKELKKTLKKIYELMGKYIIKEEKIFILKQYIQSFCINKECKREIIRMELSDEILNLSTIQKKILSKIKETGKFNYLNVSLDLKNKPETIKKHLQNLERKEVIKKYKVLIDYNKLGYIWSLCHLSIKKGGDISKLIKILNKEKRIPFISITLEDNIILDFLSKEYSELKSFLEELKWKNSEIFDYNILNVDKIFKLKEP